MKNLKFFTLCCALIMTVLPYGASAATAKPTCELEVKTPVGSVTIEDAGSVLLQKGQIVEISWESKNAEKATQGNGRTVALEGVATSSPKKTTSYSYTFKNGSKKVECSVKVIVVQGGFKDSNIITETGKPQIKGTAVGVKSVYLAIYKKDAEKPIFTSKSIPVKNNTWSTKITKNLVKGEYEMRLLGKNSELNTISTGTITVGKKMSAGQTTFVAESVPLLVGGTVKSGGTAAVAYIQLINIGTATGTVESITLTQKGSAETEVIKGFTVTDNKSTTNVTVGSDLKPIQFKDGSATIPLSTIIKAGDMRLFTIKMQLTNSVITNLGKQIKLEVSGIGTTGAERVTLPIRGVTWTIGV